MEVIINETYEQTMLAAAKVIAGILNTKPDAVLGLATGSTPVGLYKELIRMHTEEGLDFSKVATFNLDEYIGLPPSHSQSYHRFMHEKLFDRVNIQPQNVHVPLGTAGDPKAYCRWYEEEIVKRGGIDLQVLGIGSDGHIGFNEPGSSLGSRTRVKTLAEQTIDDNSRFFAKREDVPIYAITMGVGTILDARKIVLLASGTGKAEIIAAAIEGPVCCANTASALQMHADVAFFLDCEAAGKLKMFDYYKWVQEKKPNSP